MKPVIGIVGLGIMGGAMAEALLSASYKVIGFDVAKAPRLACKKRVGESLLHAPKWHVLQMYC